MAPNLETLVATADLIVDGIAGPARVGRTEGGSGDWMQIRQVPIKVTDTLKGSVSGDVTVDEGYWDADGAGVAQREIPWTLAGTRVLVFLRFQKALDFTAVADGKSSTPSEVLSIQYVGPQGPINLDTPKLSSDSTLQLFTSASNEIDLTSQVRTAIATVQERRIPAMIEPVPLQPSGPPDRESLLWSGVSDSGASSSLVFALYGKTACLDLVLPTARTHATCISASDLEQALEKGFQITVPEVSLVVVAARPGLATSIASRADGSQVVVPMNKLEGIEATVGVVPDPTSPVANEKGSDNAPNR